MPEVTGDDLIGALMASLNEEVAPVAAPVAVAPVAVAPVAAPVVAVAEVAPVVAVAEVAPVAEKPVKPITPMPELPPGQIEVVPDVEAKPAEKELVPVGAVKANAKATAGMVKVEITVTRRGKPFVTSTWKRLEEAQKAGDKITDWGVTKPVSCL